MLTKRKIGRKYYPPGADSTRHLNRGGGRGKSSPRKRTKGQGASRNPQDDMTEDEIADLLLEKQRILEELARQELNDAERERTGEKSRRNSATSASGSCSKSEESSGPSSRASPMDVRLTDSRLPSAPRVSGAPPPPPPSSPPPNPPPPDSFISTPGKYVHVSPGVTDYNKAGTADLSAPVFPACSVPTADDMRTRKPSPLSYPASLQPAPVPNLRHGIDSSTSRFTQPVATYSSPAYTNGHCNLLEQSPSSSNTNVIDDIVRSLSVTPEMKLEPSEFFPVEKERRCSNTLTIVEYPLASNVDRSSRNHVANGSSPVVTVKTEPCRNDEPAGERANENVEQAPRRADQRHDVPSSGTSSRSSSSSSRTGTGSRHGSAETPDMNEDASDSDDEDEGDPDEEYESDDIDVESMLEESRQVALEEIEKAQQAGDPAANVRLKKVLKYRKDDYFEVLPEGWVQSTHSSGIPIFLHRESRVCTMARPYFLGPGSLRNHGVPLSAIPCLYQNKLKEWDKERKLAAAANLLPPKSKESTSTGNSSQSNPATPSGCPFAANDAGPSGSKSTAGHQTPSDSIPGPSAGPKMPDAHVEGHDDERRQNLAPEDLHEYCQRRFEFETVKIYRFNNWTEHRNFHKKKRARRRRPGLPSNVKLIAVPKKEGSGSSEVYLNPHGKTSVALLHEYVQRVMHCSADYELGQTTSASQPYSATVFIEGTRYSTGHGNNKRQAKLDAARRTLAVLIPSVEFTDDHTVKLPDEVGVFDLFNEVSITDSRVYELSVKAGQPTPYQILMECLKRNSTFGDTQLNTNISLVKHQQHEFTMTVGKDANAREVKVLCSNKKEGKQKASQHMLALLHPHLDKWSSLLRLYGYGSNNGSGSASKTAAGGPSCSLGPDSLPPRAVPTGGSTGPARVRGDSQAAKPSTAPNKVILDKLYREMKRLFAEEHPQPLAIEAPPSEPPLKRKRTS